MKLFRNNILLEEGKDYTVDPETNAVNFTEGVRDGETLMYYNPDIEWRKERCGNCAYWSKEWQIDKGTRAPFPGCFKYQFHRTSFQKACPDFISRSDEQ